VNEVVRVGDVRVAGPVDVDLEVVEEVARSGGAAGARRADQALVDDRRRGILAKGRLAVVALTDCAMYTRHCALDGTVSGEGPVASVP
jgi:hypothetical protein